MVQKKKSSKKKGTKSAKVKLAKPAKKKAKKKAVKKAVKKAKPKTGSKTKRRVQAKKEAELYVDIASLKKAGKRRRAKKGAIPAAKKENPKARKHLAIAALLFNLLLPGFGSIIGGDKKGVKQLLLWGFSWIAGIFLSMLAAETLVYLGYIIGFGGATIAWVWAFGSSVQIIKKSRKA